MFTQNSVFFEWPFTGPMQGRTVRFFDPLGPFMLKQVHETWIVFDNRVTNSRGGPDVGVRFQTREDAEEFVRGGGVRG